MEGVLHTGGTGGLHAVNLDLGAQALDGKRHAGNQTAAADGHDNRIHIGQLVEDFQTDGPLPRNDQLIVIGVDEGHAGLLLQLHGAVMGIIIGALDQLYVCAQPFGALHLHNRRAVRHTDNALDAHAGGGQRHALRVVARRAGNHALGTLLGRELADFIVGTAHLEAAGDLQILGFQVEVGAGAQARGCNQVGLAGNLLQDEFGVVDFIQCKHGVLLLFWQ